MEELTTRDKWNALQTSIDETYLADLNAVDPDGIGIGVTCPNCQHVSWIKLPRSRGYIQCPIEICCPNACGYFGHLQSFGSRADHVPEDFGTQELCRRDGTEFRTNGKIFRCPVCAIENPRELMSQFVNRVRLISEYATQEDLSEKLGSLVSAFDGIMRASNKIAIKNAVAFNVAHPEVKSFQDICTAQKKLLTHIDLSKCMDNWMNFVTTFQKRHAFSHSLGVADEKFIVKTGFSPCQKGRTLKLTRAELIEFSESCEKIVRSYFGAFLS